MKKGHLKTGLIVLAVCLFAAVIAYAVTKTLKNANNRFYPSSAEITVIENDKAVSGTNTVALTADTGGDSLTAEKEVKLKNTSSNSGQELFVRTAIYPKYENQDYDYDVYIPNGGFPESINGNTFTMGNVTFNLADNWNNYWLYSGGFFYYKTVLGNGEETEPLLQSVSIYYNQWQDHYEEGADLRVDVLADCIQSVGGAVESRWTDSGLSSNDATRPSESDAQAAIAAFTARDGLTSGAAITADSLTSSEGLVISDYMLEKILNMVTTVNVTTIYEYPQEEEIEILNDDAPQAEESLGAEDFADVAENDDLEDSGLAEPEETE